MADAWEYMSTGMDGPVENAAVVTPNDSADLPNFTRALALSADGVVTVDMVGVGTNVAIPMRRGENPYRVRRVYATGTDAVDIVAIW